MRVRHGSQIRRARKQQRRTQPFSIGLPNVIIPELEFELAECLVSLYFHPWKAPCNENLPRKPTISKTSMAWIVDWATEKAAGAAHAGLQMGGNFAGNAVGSVGSMIENAGRGVGDGISGAIGGVGSRVNDYGEGIKSSMAPSTPTKKTAISKPVTSTKQTAPDKQQVLASAKLSEKALPKTTIPSKQPVSSDSKSTTKLSPIAASKPVKPYNSPNTSLNKSKVPAAPLPKVTSPQKVVVNKSPTASSKHVSGTASQKTPSQIAKKAPTASAKRPVSKTGASTGTLSLNKTGKVTSVPTERPMGQLKT